MSAVLRNTGAMVAMAGMDDRSNTENTGDKAVSNDTASRGVARTFRPTGTHLLADFSGLAAGVLADAGLLENLLRQAALDAGASIVFSHFHGFGAGQGVTGVVLLAESHITIHTWPENGFAAVDIFMCGAARPQDALASITNALGAGHCVSNSMQRGA